MRFHGGGTAWNHVAMDQAIVDSGLAPDEVSHERTGIIMGSGGPSTRAIVEAADVARAKGPKRVGPFAVPKVHVLDRVGDALDLVQDQGGSAIRFRRPARPPITALARPTSRSSTIEQDVMFAGGCEELDWTLSVLFDAMGAMSSAYNDTPSRASRAYDKNRDGFVISGRRGRAGARGIRAGKGAGRQDLWRDRRLWRDVGRPRHGRAFRRGRRAVHAPGCAGGQGPDRLHQPARDLDARSAIFKEIEAIREVFGSGDKCPPISATKSLTGHSQGATGAA